MSIVHGTAWIVLLACVSMRVVGVRHVLRAVFWPWSSGRLEGENEGYYRSPSMFSSLRFRTSGRPFAPQELYFSLHDSALVKLTKNKKGRN